MILLTAVVLGSLSANAQKEADLVISAGDAKSITLGNDMKVVFVHAREGRNDVRISKEAMRKLHVNFENGALMLESQKRLEETVYVMVNNPSKVTVGDNTALASEGILRSDLDLFVSPGATVKLKTTGKFNAFPLGDIDLRITRTPLFSNASANVN